MIRSFNPMRPVLAATALALCGLLPGSLAVGHVTHAASAATLPTSCVAIAAARPGARDGNYIVFAGMLPVSVYCLNMATSPETYLNLRQTGPQSNYSETFRNRLVPTLFSRVRLLTQGEVSSSGTATCQTALCIDGSDTTFANGQGYTPFRYADAYGCYNVARANVDLRGTLLKVPADSFTYASYIPYDEYIHYSNNNQVVNLQAGGLCGEALPNTSPLLSVEPLVGSTQG